jgi:hypothetical protein
MKSDTLRGVSATEAGQGRRFERGRVSSDCDVGDRVIYHDPTPLHGVFHAVVTRRVTMPSGAVRYELDLDDPRPGDPPFRFATEREIHADVVLCIRCTTDVSVAGSRFTRS